MSEQWIVWLWNERPALWVQVDEGTKGSMRRSLARRQSAAARLEPSARYAMSAAGEPLPEPSEKGTVNERAAAGVRGTGLGYP